MYFCKQTFHVFRVCISQKSKGVIVRNLRHIISYIKTKILTDFHICISVPLMHITIITLRHIWYLNIFVSMSRPKCIYVVSFWSIFHFQPHFHCLIFSLIQSLKFDNFSEFLNVIADSPPPASAIMTHWVWKSIFDSPLKMLEKRH